MKKTTLSGVVAPSVLALTVAVLLSGSVSAQSAAGGRMRADADADGRITQAEFVQARVQRLTAADADRDGSVTRDEARAHRTARRAERLARRFDRLDANKDGAISRSEFETRPQRADGPRAEGREGRRGDRMHGGRHARRAGLDGARGADRGGERGPVVIAEVQARAAETFARLDANHDGVLTAEERRAGRQGRGAGRRMAAPVQPSPSAPASE